MDYIMQYTLTSWQPTREFLEFLVHGTEKGYTIIEINKLDTPYNLSCQVTLRKPPKEEMLTIDWEAVGKLLAPYISKEQVKQVLNYNRINKGV